MRLSIRNLLGCIALLFLAVFSVTGVSAAQVVGQEPLKPKIVLQLGHGAPVKAIIWANDGKHLMSLAEDGSIMVWDTTNGALLDHAQISLPGSFSDLRFRALRLEEAKKSISIFYFFDEHKENACPKEARGKSRWCSFSLNLENRELKSDGTLLAPESYFELGTTDEELNFPLSPDGQLHPIPNASVVNRNAADADAENSPSDQTECYPQYDLCRYEIILVSVNEKHAPILLTGRPRSIFLDADLSADGLQLLRLERLQDENGVQIGRLNLSTGTGQTSYFSGRAYHKVTILNDERYVMFSDRDESGSELDYGVLSFPPALIVDPGCALSRDCREIESFAQMLPLDEQGNFLGLAAKRGIFYVNPGVGAHYCSYPTVANPDDYNEICPDDEADGPRAEAFSINIADSSPASGKWRRMEQLDWQGQVINSFQLSHDRKQVAVVTDNIRVTLFDISEQSLRAAPRELAKIMEQGGKISEPVFTPDDSRIAFTRKNSADGGASDLYIIDAKQPKTVRKYSNFSSRIIAAGNDRIFGLNNDELIDTNSGEIIAKNMSKTKPIKAGAIERSQLIWTASDDGSIEFWSSSDGSKQLTLYVLPDNRFFLLTPEGRYDTNLGPDTDMVRWIVPDAPWQSLAPQTFMRNFYEPGLYKKLLECRAADDCGGKFKKLTSFTDLTRALPQVRITGVSEIKGGTRARVTFEARENEGIGKTKSGLFSPRLFLNNRLIGQYPNEPYVVGDNASDAGDASDSGEALKQWRTKNRVKIKPDAKGVFRYSLDVPLPTRTGTETLSFSAYAFNESRIKSETATLVYRRKIKPVSRKPKAYIISIGINDYDQDRLDLNYAAPDARLIGDRLKTIPGYEVRQLVLAGDKSSDGKSTHVGKLTIQNALALLMPDRRKFRETYLRKLRDAGIDASMLESSTPDDIVIVSFSGHGWADKDGDFYLLPSDSKWPDHQDLPIVSTFLSTTDITYLLRQTQAAEISLIIDACHSGASVDSGDFKPGPMGDRGLGQLAYDKGIRILTAAQASDVALEDASLNHGLLTYALVGNERGGLTAESGHAERDSRGRILLDKWLSYAIKRLPELATDNRLKGLGALDGSNDSSFFFPGRTATKKQKIQQPVLFDFNTKSSFVPLRE